MVEFAMYATGRGRATRSKMGSGISTAGTTCTVLALPASVARTRLTVELLSKLEVRDCAAP